ncbi:MAG TPA: serine/threonine-protein kinase [Polyangiaceae bacterium]|nr:serine/threonine-protein kinase [Polyangiaceae bacterium]
MQTRQDPLLGSLAAGRYRLVRLLGEGGMGRVYLAEHEAIQKKVALKVLRNEFSARTEIVTRFQQEAISASRIKHPNVLDVFDFGQLEDGSFFLAMEFLEGNDLADELSRVHQVHPRRAVRVAVQVCRALGAAHSRGVIHRDMKPENVFLHRTDDGDEIVKILDFGIALLRRPEEGGGDAKRRLTRAGMIFGTPEYMAPEQAAGRSIDQRVDTYAVGVILFEMLVGTVPFTDKEFMAVLAAHQNNPVPTLKSFAPDLSVSPELEALVYRALAKAPEDRFQSAGEFAAGLLATPEGAGSARASGRAPAVPVPPVQVREPAATLIEASPSSTGRAQTIDVTLAAVETTPTRGRWPYLLAGFGVVTFGAAAALALFVLRGGVPVAADALPMGSAVSRASARAAPTPVPPEPPTTPASEPATVDGSDTEPEPAAGKVALEVVTLPPGALVTKGGYQVCDTTPCTVSADPGETLELAARRGTLHGTAKVLAQSDQKVTITLVAPRRASNRTTTQAPAAKSTSDRLCEVQVDGLKILRPCE